MSLSRTEADCLTTYDAPSRTVAVIDPDPRLRDAVVRALSPLYRVADYPDAEAAVGRTVQPPAAVVMGDATPAAHGRPPLVWLLEQPVFHHVPMVLCLTQPLGGSRVNRRDKAADAVIEAPFRDRDLLDLVSGLGNRAVEESWQSLPESPREALVRGLEVYGGLARLIQSGSRLDYHQVTHACAPVLEVVRKSGQRYVFEGLRNHNDLAYVHSLRVATLLTLFGLTIGLEDGALMTLASAGLVHDIGKSVIPDSVMNKTTPLTEAERAVAWGHVDATVRFLEQQSDVPRAVITIAGQHHERLDGSGYPRQLAGEQLNDLSRMGAIVDVFCALTERRPHRAAMGPYQALEVMQENIRHKLDQSLVRLFSGMLVRAATA